MSKSSDYPRIVYVTVRHAPTFKNLSNIIAHKLIPASSMLSDVPLDEKSIDEIQQIIESRHLDVHAYDQTYREINVLKSLEDYEWVILKRPGAKLLAAAIRGYVYTKNSSSPIHHYIEFIAPSLTIPYSNIDSVLMHIISSADNLTQLPDSAAELINAHRPGSLAQVKPSAKITPKLIPLSDIRARHEPKVIKSPAFENYFASVVALHEYLASNVSDLSEQYAPDSDLSFIGNWLDGKSIQIVAYRLTDSRGNGAWYAQGIFQ